MRGLPVRLRKDRRTMSNKGDGFRDALIFVILILVCVIVIAYVVQQGGK